MPIIIGVLAVTSAATPEHMHGTRLGIAKVVQLLHPYSVPETLFISIVIFAPDVLTVSEWIFGAQPPCDSVADYGGNCLIVNCVIAGWGAFGIVVWAISSFMCNQLTVKWR